MIYLGFSGNARRALRRGAFWLTPGARRREDEAPEDRTHAGGRSSVGLDPAHLDLSDFPADEAWDLRATAQAKIAHNLAWLRRLGYEADVCGVAADPKPAADLLLTMMRAKRYGGIVFGADIRLSVRHTELFERLLNLAQVTKPDIVIVCDIGWDDTVRAVRRWFPSSDSG